MGGEEMKKPISEKLWWLPLVISVIALAVTLIGKGL